MILILVDCVEVFVRIMRLKFSLKKRRWKRLKVAKKVTENCIINEQGKVVFYRKNGNSKKQVVLDTIEDAISQNFHILESLFIEVVKTYDANLIKTGEISTVRDVLFELEDKVNEMAASLNPEKINLSYLVEDFKGSRNRHKKNIVSILEKNELEIDDLAQAQLSAVKRIKELQGIIIGTIAQTKKLTEIRISCERKIIYAHNILAEYEFKLSRINSASEKEKKKLISKALRDIAGEGANKVVFTLNAVTRVSPYKERVESNEVQKLTSLYNDFEEGNLDLNDVISIIAAARSRLKRVVRKSDDFKLRNHWR